MQTEFTTAADERVQRWVARIWYEMPKEIYFGKFMKEDPNAIIEVKRDLEGQPGDKLNYSLANKLSGTGVTNDDTLEGSEEELDVDTDSVTLVQKRNAVRLKGRMSMKRTAFNQEEVAKDRLKTWLAETVDDGIFTELASSPTTSVFGGSATSVATLAAAGLITPAKIDSMIAKAKKADPKIWPVRVDGDDHYVLVMHTDCGFDLRQNSTWQGYQQNGAQKQGRDNPIFSGMFGIYNNTVLHEHEKVPAALTGGSGGDVPYAVNLFLGRQAAVYASGMKPQAWTKEFDYGASLGFAIGAIWNVRKAIFAGVDHGVIAGQFARTNN